MPLKAANLDLLKLELDGLFGALRSPQQPSRVYACLEADLPSASTYINCIARVTDLNCLAFSDGTAWYRADTGAAI